MTKITSLSLNRRYEGRDRDGNLIPRKEKIDIPRQVYKLECGRETFDVLVGPGQAINTRKMCRKILKELRNKNNVQEKQKFVSKGYKGQQNY